MELELFNRHKAIPGDVLVHVLNHSIRMRFKGFGHDNCVIAALEDGVLPRRAARDIILRQRDCRVLLKPNNQPSIRSTDPS